MTPSQQRDELLAALKTRFEKSPARHKDADWARMLARLGGTKDGRGSLGGLRPQAPRAA